MKRILATVILATCTTLVYANAEPPKTEPSGATPSKAEVAARGQQIAGVVCVACPRSSVAAADRALAAVVADRDQIVEPSAMLRLRADQRLVPR